MMNTPPDQHEPPTMSWKEAAPPAKKTTKNALPTWFRNLIGFSALGALVSGPVLLASETGQGLLSHPAETVQGLTLSEDEREALLQLPQFAPETDVKLRRAALAKAANAAYYGQHIRSERKDYSSAKELQTDIQAAAQQGCMLLLDVEQVPEDILSLYSRGEQNSLKKHSRFVVFAEGFHDNTHLTQSNGSVLENGILILDPQLVNAEEHQHTAALITHENEHADNQDEKLSHLDDEIKAYEAERAFWEHQADSEDKTHALERIDKILSKAAFLKAMSRYNPELTTLHPGQPLRVINLLRAGATSDFTLPDNSNPEWDDFYFELHAAYTSLSKIKYAEELAEQDPEDKPLGLMLNNEIITTSNEYWDYGGNEYYLQVSDQIAEVLLYKHADFFSTEAYFTEAERGNIWDKVDTHHIPDQLQMALDHWSKESPSRARYPHLYFLSPDWVNNPEDVERLDCSKAPKNLGEAVATFTPAQIRIMQEKVNAVLALDWSTLSSKEQTRTVARAYVLAYWYAQAGQIQDAINAMDFYLNKRPEAAYIHEMPSGDPESQLLMARLHSSWEAHHAKNDEDAAHANAYEEQVLRLARRSMGNEQEFQDMVQKLYGTKAQWPEGADRQQIAKAVAAVDGSTHFRYIPTQTPNDVSSADTCELAPKHLPRQED